MDPYLALAGSLVSLILLAVKLWSGHETRERKKAKALADVEAEETDAAMAHVDALYDADRVRRGESVLLPTDPGLRHDGQARS